MEIWIRYHVKVEDPLARQDDGRPPPHGDAGIADLLRTTGVQVQEVRPLRLALEPLVAVTRLQHHPTILQLG